MMYPMASMPETTWGSLGSSLVTFLFFWEMFRRYCPPELTSYLEKFTIKIKSLLNPNIQISIHEYINLRPHEAYAMVEAYLSAISSKDAKRLKAEMPKDSSSKLMLSIDEKEKTTDEFNGVKVEWISAKASSPQRPMSLTYYPEPERRYYELKFHKKYKEMVTDLYLQHVIHKGMEVQARNRQRKLFTNGYGNSYWSHIVFEHPASFETLAMEKEKKEEIIDDLLTFTKGKDFYARIGKAWKRGYLLFGPPGTGKSTMIAAMANLLDYDVYDLELTSVRDNTELRRLLTETTAKSILVIEDIDCSLDLTGQRVKRKDKEKEKPAHTEGDEGKKGSSRKEKEDGGSKVTLSGLLNFIDGLWSACAGERLIVFTTNYVNKLDPALTRRGRMDKHIELGYCKFEGFKVLAKNYLDIEEHALFGTVEEIIGEVEITPADVAENLMPKSAKQGPEECLSNLIRALEDVKRKKMMKCTEEVREKEEISENVAAAQENHET